MLALHIVIIVNTVNIIAFVLIMLHCIFAPVQFAQSFAVANLGCKKGGDEFGGLFGDGSNADSSTNAAANSGAGSGGHTNSAASGSGGSGRCIVEWIG